MLGHIFSTTLFLMGASVFTAQALQVSLTSACSATIQDLFTAPEAACLNLSALLPFLVNPDQTVPRAIDIWLTGLCSAGSCSNESIATIVANVTHGCSEDFSKANIDIINIQDKITDIAQKVYPTVRKAVCLKDTTANELCVTQTLKNIEGVIGKLGPDDLDIDMLNQNIQTFLTSNITDVACTSCMKSAYTIGRNDFPEQVSLVDRPFEQLCGASFLDGNAPSDIVATANQNSFSANVVNANSGALSTSIRWPTSAWSLLILSATLVSLA